MPATLTAIEEIRIDEDTFKEIEHVFIAENCPFPSCRSNNLEFGNEAAFSTWYFVQCNDCGAHGPARELKAEAVEAWNEAKR